MHTDETAWRELTRRVCSALGLPAALLAAPHSNRAEADTQQQVFALLLRPRPVGVRVRLVGRYRRVQVRRVWPGGRSLDLEVLLADQDATCPAHWGAVPRAWVHPADRRRLPPAEPG